MNQFERTLYTELMALCAERDLFFFKDHELEGVTYRVFSYHMGSYTDFCQPSALECRGALFLMNDDVTDAVELVSLPFQKFFNIFENPFTMEPEYDRVTYFEEKADGSMISTYMHKGSLRLKSKTSLSSLMAVDAMAYLEEPEHHVFRDALEYYANLDFTVIMEWCDPKPESRIVLFYEKPQLRVFGLRSNITGEIIDYRSTDIDYLCDAGVVERDDYNGSVVHLNAVIKYSVDRISVDDIDDVEAFALNVPNEDGIEGYIMVLDNDYRIKIKTQWYITQHRLKDSVTNEGALFACAVSGSTDDLKSIFHDNPGAIKVITEMEEFVEPLYAQFVHDVERFVEFNSELDRKSFAIKGQKELTHQQFHCAMSLYLGKTVDYSAVLIKNSKLYLSQYNGNVVTETEE